MNMTLIVLLILLILGIAIGSIVIGKYIRERFIIPTGNVLYTDTESNPGEVLQASTLPLIGKPDYILKKDGNIIPVEIKRGKTPQQPYQNHVAQLYAYCLLVKETYGRSPPYGIIKYPNKEFTLTFPTYAEEHLRKIVNEIISKKSRIVSRNELKNVCNECMKNHM